MSSRSSLGSSKYIEMAVDLMVIPRSCSSARVSIERASPALPVEMIPALARSESVRVDLPWSTVKSGPAGQSDEHEKACKRWSTHRGQ